MLAAGLSSPSAVLSVQGGALRSRLWACLDDLGSRCQSHKPRAGCQGKDASMKRETRHVSAVSAVLCFESMAHG